MRCDSIWHGTRMKPWKCKLEKGHDGYHQSDLFEKNRIDSGYTSWTTEEAEESQLRYMIKQLGGK